MDNLALVAWKEARGDGNDAMLAIMHICLNRISYPGFPTTLHEVIYQKNAFTSMSVSTDPEYNLEPKPGDIQYGFCEAQAPLARTQPDITGGAHYYADLKYVTSGWFLRNIVNDPLHHPHTVKIGRQDFYV